MSEDLVCICEPVSGVYGFDQVLISRVTIGMV